MGNPITTIPQSVASNGKWGNAIGSASNLSGTQIPSSSGNLAVSIPAMKIPQPYDSGTVQGQLQNDALAKQYTSNKYYDSLTDQAPKLMNQNSIALNQANGLLGQGVDAVNQAKTAGDKYFAQADDDYAAARNYLNKADSEGDWWYGQSRGAYGKADSLLGQLTNNLEYTREGNKWYDDYTRGMLGRSQNMLDTGSIPQPIMDAMLSAMTQGVNQSVGANVNDLAARGVLNSSVTNRALSDASRSVSDSMNANYLNAFNTLLAGTNDTARAGAEGGKAFSDINFQLNSGYQNAMDSVRALGESYGLTGSRRVGDLVGISGGYDTIGDSMRDYGNDRIKNLLDMAAGYNNSAAGYGSLCNQWLNTLAQNRSERESLMNAIPGYWDNTLAPMGLTQMTLQQGLEEFLNHKKDTAIY
ncbi:MAG: hypothetical protein LBF92_06460 [Synergistaceae bacterium]|jgi:hypothetical protein|nr:hypothetical protein [Synergistaceae bacterium]